jgi:phage terminase large subunit GpA-like protein
MACAAATGLTLKRKMFPSGSLVCTGGNSTASLRQKSVRYVILNDVDDFPRRPTQRAAVAA